MVALLSTGVAAPALAADTAADDAGRYVSEVTGVRPAVPGLNLTVEDGASVTVASTTDQTVIVLGYAEEPYLRFTPSGVDENTASLTSGINASGVVAALPESAGADARNVPARWVHRSDEPKFTWRDLRVGWNGQERPPVVAADPDAAHEVFTWGIPFTVDGAPGVVVGSVRWTAASSWVRTALLTLAVLAVLAALAGAAWWWWQRRRRPGPQQGDWRVPADRWQAVERRQERPRPVDRRRVAR